MDRRFAHTYALALATTMVAFAAQGTNVKHIVIVYSALADRSGWSRSTEILKRRGFQVTTLYGPIIPHAHEVATIGRVLDLQEGSTLLVGHDFGAMVPAEAGNRNNVVGLVHVAASWL
ncbi:hypothetical protein [Telmatospirillum sp.]|uniref:hypothetical protein n=1 Tax=Telmatospirillum sp. TaxID=2079197 RepID=UPI0028426D92|nr:hypothetical protein [Telmatospirillum sp.]MDR3436207.1 hypothetical protein [Telmatospirillum sp.]